MQTFLEWLQRMDEDASLRTGRETIEILKDVDWIDDEGVGGGKLEDWEMSTKEYKLRVKHPKVGNITVTLSKKSKVTPKQLAKTAQSEYRKAVHKQRDIIEKRKRVV